MRFLMCTVLALPLAAQQPAPAGPDLEAEMAEFFARFDADKDAKVTLAEVKQYARDKAGYATAAEIAMEMGETFCLVLAADTDDDDFVTRDEYRALRKARVADAKYKPPLSRADVETLKKELCAPVLEWLFEGADANGDGKLTAEEYEKAAGGTEEFNAADKDGNGFLTKAELEADWLRELGKTFELPRDEAPGVYSKAGRTWVIKQTTREGEAESTGYSRIEVVSVDAKEATIRTQSLDKDRKPDASKPVESKISLVESAKPTGEETITVAAGKFECSIVESEGDKRWFARDYPGLVVKQVRKSGKAEITTELVEFKP